VKIAGGELPQSESGPPAGVASRDPGAGTDKPERLSGNLAGYWSRRIDQEHRLTYTMQDDELVIVQARYHY